MNMKENTIDLAIINCDKYKIDEDLIKVMKPGAYLFGFDKSNKSYKSVCDIEDIGFVIKDSISYFYLEDNKVKEDTICLAMKPLSEKNFVDNVMKWGTGGLNIDKCRIAHNEKTNSCIRKSPKFQGICGEWSDSGEVITTANPEGRYPANFIISEDVAPVLDKQSGILKSGGGDFRKKNGTSMFFKGEDKRELKIYQANQGGASRYFKNVNSYKELLKYIAVMGLPPKQGKVLFLGFDDIEYIIKEINEEKETSYEFIGGIE